MEKKKRKVSIWWKIILIICLFIVAALGGYGYGALTQPKVKKQTREVAKTSSSKKQQVYNHRMNKNIELSNGLILKVESLDRYKQIEGLTNAVGVKIKITNKSDKEQKIPYKYSLNLLFDKKSLSSIGIYDSTDLVNGTLTNIEEKLPAGKSITAVYMYKANDVKDLSAYKAQLDIKDNDDKHIVTLELDPEQFITTTSGSVSSNNANNEGADNYYNQRANDYPQADYKQNDYDAGYNQQPAGNAGGYNDVAGNQDNNDVAGPAANANYADNQAGYAQQGNAAGANNYANNQAVGNRIN